MGKRPHKSTCRRFPGVGRSEGGGGNDSDNDTTGIDPVTGIHKGSIPLDDIKSSEDFQRRIIYETAPKRKYALNLGYLGSQYQGLQINPGAITVEAVLEKALFLAGGIAECNFGCLNKLQWTRTARTDRGVHALSQCCAMKLVMPLDGRESFINDLNSFLPDDIRIHSISKVTKNFHGKILCTKRRYHYLLPTYILQDSSYIVGLLNEALAAQGTVADAGRAGGFADPGSVLFCGPDSLRSVREKLSNYRIDNDKLVLLRSALKRYVGTKPYHNFTTGKSPADANAKRYILSFDCGDPFVDAVTGCEWVLLSVLGQSFLLNQIRKMVGLAIGVCDGSASLVTMDQALSPKKMEIPMVPGLGLYLDKLFFEAYNNKQEAEYQRLAQSVHKKAAATVTATATATATATVPESAMSEDSEPPAKVQRIVDFDRKMSSEEKEVEHATATADASIVTNEKQQVAPSTATTGVAISLATDATTAADVTISIATAAAVAAGAAAGVTVTTAAAVGDDNGDDGPSLGEKIDWFENPVTKSRMDKFRDDVIRPHIFQEDRNSLCFLYYADYLRVHPYKYIAKEFVSKKNVVAAAAGGGGGGSASGQSADGGADAERGGAPRGVPPKVVIKGPVTGSHRS